jgi:excisionase family DNA binding protein
MHRDASSQAPPAVAATAEPLLTPHEVAEILRLTPRTVVRLARSGDLPHVRVSKRDGYRFKRSDVDAFVASKTAELSA